MILVHHTYCVQWALSSLASASVATPMFAIHPWRDSHTVRGPVSAALFVLHWFCVSPYLLHDVMYIGIEVVLTCTEKFTWL